MGEGLTPPSFAYANATSPFVLRKNREDLVLPDSVRLSLICDPNGSRALGFVDKGYPLQDCDEIDEAEV